ncbi:MAG: hypothetical protein QM570_11555 [Planctomycetota bacterium]|nr:hypothetical protein [Planctomycetota bacterium]
MQQVTFDKERAEALIEAMKRREPMMVEGWDVPLLAAVCLAILQTGHVMEIVEKADKKGEHPEHIELEVAQSRNDWWAVVLFLQKMVTYVRVGEYDKYYDKKVMAAVELTQEPRYQEEAIWGLRPGGPLSPEAG